MSKRLLRSRPRKKFTGYLSFALIVASGIWFIFGYRADSGEVAIAAPVQEVAEITEYLPESQGELVRHVFFTLSFNKQHKQANWVYYSLGSESRTANVKRTNNFREDPKVGSGSAKSSDYTKSGYDRGHLCPAGDMTQSVEAMSETFYMSNISPQFPSFNRGIWKLLEEQVRKWGKREQIYVVTGPVFEDDKGEIGVNRVTIPGYFYKVVYSPSRRQMKGFLLPNEKGNRELSDYVVSVDSVESVTGIDFFPQLADTLENRLEACPERQKW